MLFADLALARRLEATDAAVGVEFSRTHARLYPEVGATFIAVAGGHAAFAGVDSPLTQAFGLGLNGVVGAAEIEKMEEFYRSRGAAVNVETCPLADASLRTLLNSRGYQVIEQTNVLARPLPADEPQLSAESRVQVRQPKPEEMRLWASTVAKGFVSADEPPPVMLEAGETFFHMTTSTCFLAEIDGQAAGGAVVAFHRGIATLFGASTLPAFRNRGVQTALLQARLQFAAKIDCELAMVSTSPGSISQRNVERQGFQVVYTRSKYMKAWQ